MVRGYTSKPRRWSMNGREERNSLMSTMILGERRSGRERGGRGGESEIERERERVREREIER